MTATPEETVRLLFALRQSGVTDPRVLDAMERADRALFVTGLFADRAYEDVALPIAHGQTISQPSVVGLMTQALEVSPRDKVLEVGTGSGYQAAILARLARRVYTLDRHRDLVRDARALFERWACTTSPRSPPTARAACPSRRPSTASWSRPPPRTRPAPSWRNCGSVASWCFPWASPTRCRASSR